MSAGPTDPMTPCPPFRAYVRENRPDRRLFFKNIRTKTQISIAQRRQVGGEIHKTDVLGNLGNLNEH
jgi:hypothetical protein